MLNEPEEYYLIEPCGNSSSRAGTFSRHARTGSVVGAEAALLHSSRFQHGSSVLRRLIG
jgi:hypothetical protein